MENTSSLPYHSSLIQSGLSPQQATLYETLIRLGGVPASKLALESGLSRPLTYKVLDEMVPLGLVEKNDRPGKIAVFNAVHPVKLKEILDARLELAQSAKVNLESILGRLTSDFNLVSGKPGVQLYEGMSGIQQVLNDSLSSKTEIYTYADVESVDKYIPDINREYVAKREKLNLKKKGIAFDTPETRYFLEGYHAGITEMKLISWRAMPFKTIMQIYDGKISYFTLGETNLVGIIVSDPHIYQMHKEMFEFLWNSPLTRAPDSPDTTTTIVKDS